MEQRLLVTEVRAVGALVNVMVVKMGAPVVKLIVKMDVLEEQKEPLLLVVMDVKGVRIVAEEIVLLHVLQPVLRVVVGVVLILVVQVALRVVIQVVQLNVMVHVLVLQPQFYNR